MGRMGYGKPHIPTGRSVGKKHARQRKQIVKKAFQLKKLGYKQFS